MAYNNGEVTGSAKGTTRGGRTVANASSTGYATFFFEVVGPGTSPIPLIFTAAGTTAASGVEAVADVQAYSPGGNFYACTGTGPAKAECGSEPRSFSGSKLFSLAPGVLSDIEITFGGSSTEGTGSYSAFVDPMVTIDPTFKNAREYSLIFSPNVTSAMSSTPEPSSILLLGTGLLVGVGVIRRKLML